MKKWALCLLCVLLAVLVIGGGAAWLLYTPRGLLRTDKPEDVMQAAVSSMRREDWRSEYVLQCPAETGEFEDPVQVTEDIFDAAVSGNDFVFRPAAEGDDAVQEYIVSGSGVDLMRARLTYDLGHWNMALTALGTLCAPTRTLTATVPEGTKLFLNGRVVDDRYIVERDIPYPDMTELELRFDSYPTLVRYEIGGIYENAELNAQREGGLAELYSDGTEWRWTLPEGGQYFFLVKAPAEAVVSVNGAPLSEYQLAATASYPTRLDIPEDLQPLLPSFRIYSCGGLYTRPEISAVLPDGTPLEPETGEDGSVSYTISPSAELREACHSRVEDFLHALCEYGAGHGARYGPNSYVAQNSALTPYITRASGSLYWTVGVATSYDEISSSDYFPLGDDAFLCSGHVMCTTKTKYQTVSFDLNCEMLWVRQGNAWMIRDLAFVRYDNTK